ncbi:MAG: hypothetical protein J3K34DRAFT_423254 [Monoraphidium minutum]|nr:MAG: hypothetical protein J3K34DRAFT_423254 [Monoraphidium minutum]
MRETVAIKTFSTLVHRYAKQSEDDAKREIASAREFGYGLFHNIRGDAPRDYLVIDDLAFFLEGDATAKAFAWLDRDHDAMISADEVADAVASLISARADLAATLQDTDSIVASLAVGLGCILHAVFIAFYLLIFGVDIVQGFSTLSASVLALTFVFGETLKCVFENSIYLFVAHAFDVGDTLQLAGESSWWRVKKIGLMNSSFLKANGDVVVAPNSKLRTSAVINLTRSRNRADTVAFIVDFPKSPADVKARVVDALKAHCTQSPAASEFEGAPTVTWRESEPPLKLCLKVAYTLSFAGDQASRSFLARDGLIAAAAAALAEAGASYTCPLVPAVHLKAA